MRTALLRRGRILLPTLFIGSYLPLTGCTDDSKTSGTMVQVSEEEKEHLKTKRQAYKAARPSTKAKPVTKSSGGRQRG
jgi:hypothetical protein